MTTNIPQTSEPSLTDAEANLELKEIEGLSQGQIVRKRFFRHWGAVASMVVLVPMGQAPADDDQGLGDLLSGGPSFALAGILAVAVLVPVVEEVVFRGIILPALRARLHAVAGIVAAGAPRASAPRTGRSTGRSTGPSSTTSTGTGDE